MPRPPLLHKWVPQGHILNNKLGQLNITVQELAQYLDIPEQTLRNLQHRTIKLPERDFANILLAAQELHKAKYQSKTPKSYKK